MRLREMGTGEFTEDAWVTEKALILQCAQPEATGGCGWKSNVVPFVSTRSPVEIRLRGQGRAEDQGPGHRVRRRRDLGQGVASGEISTTGFGDRSNMG